MRVSNHIKVKWSIRGDYERNATDAWANGIRARLPNKNYGQARYDPETDTVLLSRGDEITTTLNRYDHMTVIPVEEVLCNSCGNVFQDRERCPTCKSDNWIKR